MNNSNMFIIVCIVAVIIIIVQVIKMRLSGK
ncbi:Uncharacterised protein [Sarcina ventriculi]|uniref:NADH dehydrogenase subunit 1 n=1 Tax=Sarcina ventriculi TaxID=1267 RepID=A0ABP2AVB1_SARVE|nr:Uncharacterised protein [Sarcina ventriculi]SPZ49387.1 Uncharacterised protein [Sarcina ventriculi]